MPNSSSTMAFTSTIESFRESVNAIFEKIQNSDHDSTSMHFQGVFSGADMKNGIIEAKKKERDFLRNVFSGLVDRYCQIMKVQEDMRCNFEIENLDLRKRIHDIEMENDLYKKDQDFYAREFDRKRQEIQNKYMEINNLRRSYEALLHTNEKLEGRYLLVKHQSRDRIEALMKEIGDISAELRVIYHVIQAHSYADGLIAQTAIPVAVAPDEKYIMLMKVPEQQESIELMRFIQSQLLGFHNIVSDISAELRKAQNYEEVVLSLSDDRENLQKEANFYRNKMEMIKDEKLRVDQEKENLFSKNAQLQSQINGLRLELADASRNVRVKDGEINNLNAEKHDRLQAIKALEGKNKELREKLKCMKSELESHQEMTSTKIKDFACELRAQVKKEYEQLASEFMATCEERANEICSEFEDYRQDFAEKSSSICNELDERASKIMNARIGDESDLRIELMGKEIEVAQETARVYSCELLKLRQEHDKVMEWYNVSQKTCKDLAQKLLETEKQLTDCVTQSAEYKEEIKSAREILAKNRRLSFQIAKNSELEEALRKSQQSEKKLRDIIQHLRNTTSERLAVSRDIREKRLSSMQAALASSKEVLESADDFQLFEEMSMALGKDTASVSSTSSTQQAAKLTKHDKRGRSS